MFIIIIKKKQNPKNKWSTLPSRVVMFEMYN